MTGFSETYTIESTGEGGLVVKANELTFSCAGGTKNISAISYSGIQSLSLPEGYSGTWSDSGENVTITIQADPNPYCYPEVSGVITVTDHDGNQASILVKTLNAARYCTISPSSYHLPASGGSFTLTVALNSPLYGLLIVPEQDMGWVDWTGPYIVINDNVWYATYTVTVSANTADRSGRICELEVETHKPSRDIVSIVQDGFKDEITINPSTIQFGLTEYIDVTSTCDWYLGRKPIEVMIDPTSGTSGTTRVELLYDNYRGLTYKYLSFLDGYNCKEIARATVNFIEPELSVDKTFINVSEFYRTGNTFNVTSNTNWNVRIVGGDNIIESIGPTSGGSGTTTVTFANSNNLDARIRHQYIEVYNRFTSIPITIRQIPDSDCLTFEILEAGQLGILCYPSATHSYVFEYAIDGYDGQSYDWQSYELSAGTNASLVVYEGDLVRFKSNYDDFSLVGFLTTTAKFNVYGRLDSLLGNNTMANKCFSGLFLRCKNLIDASGLVFPDYTTSECYENMFMECENLVVAPSVLPATGLSTGCYYRMFAYTNITEAPKLYGRTLVDGCYQMMFYGCHQINNVWVYARTADVPQTSACLNWMYDVPSGGVVHMLSGEYSTITWTLNSPSGVPSGWSYDRFSPQINY